MRKVENVVSLTNVEFPTVSGEGDEEIASETGDCPHDGEEAVVHLEPRAEDGDDDGRRDAAEDGAEGLEDGELLLVPVELQPGVEVGQRLRVCKKTPIRS